VEGTDEERDLVRHALERWLAADWPAYVESMISARKIRAVGRANG